MEYVILVIVFLFSVLLLFVIIRFLISGYKVPILKEKKRRTSIIFVNSPEMT